MSYRSVGQWVRKAVAWAPMHGCYYIGDISCRILNRFPDWDYMEGPANVLYRIYSRCMCWSADLNDWAGFKLWQK